MKPKRNIKPKLIKRNFPRTSITLPQEAFDHLVKRAKEPQHAGNVSSVIRELVIADEKRVVANGTNGTNGTNGHS